MRPGPKMPEEAGKNRLPGGDYTGYCEPGKAVYADGFALILEDHIKKRSG